MQSFPINFLALVAINTGYQLVGLPAMGAIVAVWV
jgi:hypothetical protein